MEAFKQRMESKTISGLIQKFTPFSVQDLLKTQGLSKDIMGILHKLATEGIEVTVRFAPKSKT